MMRTQLHCTLGSTCYPKRGKTLDVRIGSRHSIDTALLLDAAEAHDVTQFGVVVAVQRSDRGSSPRTASRVPGAGQGPPEDPPAEKGSYPRESRRVERTHLLRLKLSTRHHVANRGRVPLPAARRIDPARVQGLGDLPQ